MKALLLAVLMLLADAASAEPQLYMKRDNPNELPILIDSMGCPFELGELRETVQGVLIRSRIKPTDLADYEELADSFPMLYVNVNCIEGQAPYVITVDFVGLLDERFIRFSLSGYGAYGTAPRKQQLLDSVKARVEAAITDYLKANFDL